MFVCSMSMYPRKNKEWENEKTTLILLVLSCHTAATVQIVYQPSRVKIYNSLFTKLFFSRDYNALFFLFFLFVLLISLLVILQNISR